MPLDTNKGRTLSRHAMQAEILDRKTEQCLTRAWRDNRDEAALHRLINAYTRLAVSMATKRKGYGLPVNDLIQEACLGLMKAAEKFDPDRNVLFSTYAVWWIKAALNDYIMRNISMVRCGLGSPERQLFFRSRQMRSRLEQAAAAASTELRADDLHRQVATELGVSVASVALIDAFFSGSDYSLNVQMANQDGGPEWIDALEDKSPHSAQLVQETHDNIVVKNWVAAGLDTLSERERYIVKKRYMTDSRPTLEMLGQELAISKERVRQIEADALGKLKKRLNNQCPEAAQYFND